MPLLRCLLVLLLITGVAAAAEDTLRTLDNRTISGSLVSLSDKEVTMKTSDGVVKTPLDNVIALDMRAVSGVPAGVSFAELRLTDDTTLLCKKYSIKGKAVEATLLSDETVITPLSSVASILRGAEDANLKKAFAALLSANTRRDRVVLYREGLVNDLEGTIGDADAEGNKINFRTPEGDSLDVPLANLQGLIFYRPEPPGGAEPVCLVYDTSGNTVAATKVSVKDDKVIIATANPKVTMQWNTTSIARFDYNMGKLAFLSDLIPTKVVETSAVGLAVAHRKDVNLDGDPIVLDRQYPKGLAVHAHTELEYDLKGRFKKFSAVLGIDTRIGLENQPKVSIVVDGRTVFSEVITTKGIVLVEINVAKASTLRIVVSSNNILDLHDHVVIANPKLTQ